MVTTNFHLALLAKTVDGLFAVLIAVQHINTKLTFNGASSSGRGDAALQFTMDAQNGNPIFDLR